MKLVLPFLFLRRQLTSDIIIHHHGRGYFHFTGSADRLPPDDERVV